MLAYLDQLAFSALLLLSQIVGTPDIPKEPSPDWQIVQPWTEMPDGTYGMAIISDSIGKKCELDNSKLITLDNPYMGLYELYGDEHLIDTNSIRKRWIVASMFLNVYIDCKKLAGVNQVKIQFYSYLKYFSVIHSYPKFVGSLPFYYFFPRYLYVLSAAACFFLGLVGLTIIYKLLPTEEVISYVMEDALFMFVMLLANSEIIGGLHIKYCHAAVVLGLWGGIIFFFAYLIKPKNSYIKYYILAILYVFAMSSIEYRNIMQSLIYIPVIPALILLAYLIIKGIAVKPNTFIDKFILSLCLYFGFMTAYLSYVHRTGVSSMALLVICISVFKFRKILKEVNRVIIQRQEVKVKLESEATLAQNLFIQKEKYREILHDIKSPITSLAILNSLPNDKIKPVLEKIIGQLRFVLSKIETQTEAIDWYSLIILSEKFKNMIDDYSKIYTSIEFKYSGRNDNEVVVLCTGVELLSIVSEMVTNSLKHSKNLRSIEISQKISIDSNFLIIIYKDVGSAEVLEDSPYLGQRGYTTGGSGTGLSSIKRKIENWGGVVDFGKHRNGFMSEIRLKAKIK